MQLDAISGSAVGGSSSSHRPPFKGVLKVPRPPPPSLEEYWQWLFVEHGRTHNQQKHVTTGIFVFFLRIEFKKVLFYFLSFKLNVHGSLAHPSICTTSHARALLRPLDVDDTGEIDAAALWRLLHVSLALGLTEDDCHGLVAAADLDGSGVVRYGRRTTK